MSNTRYGHSGTGTTQDQGERKDEGWESRQGGDQASEHRRSREVETADEPGHGTRPKRPQGTNTQGDMAGIGEASDESRKRLEHMWQRAFAGDESGSKEGRGTDQPPRMGGPLGPDPEHPHLPEGEQDNDEKGSGARGFDRGVDATNVGAVHQGARPEDPS